MTYDKYHDEGLDSEAEVESTTSGSGEKLEWNGQAYPLRVTIKERRYQGRELAYAALTLDEARALVDDLETLIREVERMESTDA